MPADVLPAQTSGIILALNSFKSYYFVVICCSSYTAHSVKHADSSVVLCFVVVILLVFFMITLYASTHIHQSCFTDTEANEVFLKDMSEISHI